MKTSTTTTLGILGLSALAVGGVYLLTRDTSPRPRIRRFLERIEETRNPLPEAWAGAWGVPGRAP